MNIALIYYSSPRDLDKMTLVRTVDSLNSTVRVKTGIFPYFPCVVEFPRKGYKIRQTLDQKSLYSKEIIVRIL